MSALSASPSIFIMPSVMIIFVVPLIMLGIIVWAKGIASKRNAKIGGGSEFKVKQNPIIIGSLIILVVLGGASSVFFSILYFCNIPDGPSFGATLGIVCGFGAMGIISGVGLFAAKRWQIIVSNEKIVVTPGFGKVKEFEWDDLTCVKTNQVYGNLAFTVYLKQSKKKAFTFGTVMVGGRLLEDEFRNRGSINYFRT